MNSQLLSLFTAIFAGISVGCIAKYLLHKISEFEVEKDRKFFHPLPILIKIFIPFIPPFRKIANRPSFDNWRKSIAPKIMMAGYGEEITPENVREITAYILNDCGLEGNLVPNSAKHGYDFYYNFSTGKYEVIKTEVATGAVSPLMHLLARAAISGELDLNPATCFTAKDATTGKPLYAFVSTGGSDLADAVAGFERFVGKSDENADFDIDDFTAFCTLVDGLGYEGLSDLLDVSVFATNGGNFAVDADADHLALFIHNDVTEMSNTKVDADSTIHLSANKPLVTVSANKTYKFPADVTFNTNSLYIDVLNGAKVVLDIDADNWDNMSAFFTGENVTLKLNDKKEYVLKSGYDVQLNNVHNTYLEFTGSSEFTVEGETVANKLHNYVDATSGNVTSSIVAIDHNFGMIANPVDTNSVVVIKWEAAEGYTDYLHYDTTTNKFVFDKAPDGATSVKIKATPIIGVNTETGELLPDNENVQEYEVSVVYFTDVEIRIDTNVLGAHEGEMTLLYSDSKTSYFVNPVKSAFAYSIVTDDIILDETLNLSLIGIDNLFDLAENNTKLNLATGEGATKEGTDKLKVSIGGFEATYELTLKPYSDLAFEKNNPNITVVANNKTSAGTAITGSESADVKVSELLKAIGENKPLTGAKLMIYNAKQHGYNYDLSNRTPATTVATSAEIDLTNLDQTISFKGTGDVCVVIVDADGNRLSDDHDIKVVNGVNVRSYSEIKTQSSTSSTTGGSFMDKKPTAGTTTLSQTGTGRVTKVTQTISLTDLKLGWSATTTTTTTVTTEGQNIVLLADIAMTTSEDGSWKLLFTHKNTHSYMDIAANTTFYGNCFTFDIKNGREAEAGIINLSGTIQDTKVIAKTYPEISPTVNLKYGSSAICAKNDKSKVINCYVYGARSPLRLDRSCTVIDSMFFGGTYSNIEIDGDFTLTLKGTNYTINQGFDGVAGFGITAWFNGGTKVIDNQGTLLQYNFLNESKVDMLPTMSYDDFGVPVNFDLPSLMKQFMGRETYSEIYYYDNANTLYLNSGILSIDHDMGGTMVAYGLDNYKGYLENAQLCESQEKFDEYNSIVSTFGSSLTARGISGYMIPGYIYSPMASKCEDLFKASMGAEDTYKPWGEGAYGFGADGMIITMQ